MAAENAIWGGACFLLALFGKYWFDRVNKKVDEKPASPPNEDERPICAGECRHIRKACAVVGERQSMEFEAIRAELHAIKGILLVMASKGEVTVEDLKMLISK